MDLEAPGDQEDQYTVDQATSEIVEKGDNHDIMLWYIAVPHDKWAVLIQK